MPPGARAAIEYNLLDQRGRDDRIREVTRAAFEAWQRGDASIEQIFAPLMRWRIEGRAAIAGQYESAEEFVGAVLGPFEARFAEGERFRPVAIRSIHDDGDTVIVVWDGAGVANDGVPYANSYAWFMRFEDGKVVETTAFLDSITIDELWDRVEPA